MDALDHRAIFLNVCGIGCYRKVCVEGSSSIKAPLRDTGTSRQQLQPLRGTVAILPVRDTTTRRQQL